MSGIVKKLLIKLLINYCPVLNNIFIPKAFIRKLYLAKLKEEDIVQWRVETAKDRGVKVGNNCRFYSLSIFSEPYLVEIGDDVIISGGVTFITHDGSVYLFKEDIPDIFGRFGRIKIGNNCFIGMGAMILPNVEIGDNCVIGAGAVVVSSFPDNSVIIGNPAKLVFKTSLYKKMCLNFKLTVRYKPYCFPRMDLMPQEEKREMLERLIIYDPNKGKYNNNYPQL